MSMTMLLLLAILATSQGLPSNQDSQPTLLQYALEGVVDMPRWSNYLPDDIDKDNDGTLTEKEVEQKFKSYVKDIFDQLDKNSDELITQDEFIKAGINLYGMNKIVDIAFHSFPLKRWLGYGDRNQDGFISEDDLLLPENRDEIGKLHRIEDCGGECDTGFKDDYDYEGLKACTADGKVAEGEACRCGYHYCGAGSICKEHLDDYAWCEKPGKWSLLASVPLNSKDEQDLYPNFLCSDSFGQNEAEVLCRELGHKGVESLSSISIDDHKKSVDPLELSIELKQVWFDARSIYAYDIIFDCDGSESSLEECNKTKATDSRKYHDCPGAPGKSYQPRGQRLLASVNCTMDKDIGEVHLAGGKNPSSGELHIGNTKFCGEISPSMARVVCTELGFSQGAHQVTTNNFFTDFFDFPILQRTIECSGSEEKLQDCQLFLAKYDRSCPSNGIICNTGDDLDEKYEDVASAFDSNRGFHFWWEFTARYLFIADMDGDSKVSMEELKFKAKDIARAVFKLLDQTDDMILSVSDFTNINIKHQAVINLAEKLFVVASKGKGEINLIKLTFGLEGLQAFDYNRDGIINLKDISTFGDSSQIEGLLSILSRNVDSNQDGVVKYSELENYLEVVLKHLDEDNNGYIELGEVYKLMQKSKFTCLQIEGIRTFVDGWRELIDTQAEKFLAYIFTEFDLDDNGEISLEELNNAHAPCNENQQSRDWHPTNSNWNSSNRIPCENLVESLSLPRGPNTPHMIFRGFGKSHDGLMEIVANSACVAMQPDF